MEETMTMRRFYQEVYITYIRTNVKPSLSLTECAKSVASQAVKDYEDWLMDRERQLIED